MKKWIAKFFIDNDRDIQEFDIEHEWDAKLNYSENKTILQEKLKLFFNKYAMKNIINLAKKDIDKSEQTSFQIQEINKNIEQQAQLEFEKALEIIENDKTTNLLEEIYFMPKQLTKMVALGYSKGLILSGNCGNGKSYSVIRAFKEVNKPFALISGHITSMELYRFLFEHRTEHIILDDVNILNNKNNLNMLKSALNDNSRIVSYHSSSSKLNIPNSFYFSGTIIILINIKPKSDEDLKAVESRVYSHELNFDYKTLIKVMFELVKKDYKTLTYEERMEIMRWIKDNSSSATKNFNLRKLFQVYEMYLFDKENWKSMAKAILPSDEQIELILQGCSEKKWCEITGMSRRTFYNVKKSAKVQ